MLDAVLRSTSDLAADVLTWITANAVTMLFVSVITAVVTEMVVRLLRRRSIDVLASTTSIAAGIAYITAKGIVSKLLVFGLAMYIYDHHRIFDPSPTNVLVWLAVFLCRDFIYYWIHRAEHRVKVLWASHMVHHSSEEFSFTTAVRMPWMEALYKPALSLWAPLLGFHPRLSPPWGRSCWSPASSNTPNSCGDAPCSIRSSSPLRPIASITDRIPSTSTRTSVRC